MSNSKYAAYKPADPYFNLIRRALGDLVDGEHFFDIVTDDTIYEVLYDIGWPRVIRGRTDLMAAFRGYVDNIALQSANKLVVHTTDDGRVVVLEYEVAWDRPRDESEIQQSVLLNHQDREPKDRALERLHGLSGGLERIDCAGSLDRRLGDGWR